MDDTLARKRGLKMFGTGMQIDPLLSSRGYKVTNWGHCLVALSVLVEFPSWPGPYFSLPILFRLYLNKKNAKKHLGFEEPQGWSEDSVQRTAPMAMLQHTAIVHWYAIEGPHHESLTVLPWYTRKSRASFADMPATL